MPNLTIRLMRRATIFAAVFLNWHFLSLPAQEIALPVKDGSVRFVAIGDMGTGQRPQYEVAQRMVEFREKFPFTFVITLGDNIYGSKSASSMKRKFEIPYKPLLDAGVKFYASLGNHDDTNQRFYKYFNMDGKQYYSYKKGNVQFFAIDTDYLDPKQVEWLVKELADSKSDWKIPYFHHPLYSSAARHGSSVEVRSVLEPIFLKYGVQVVFSGHDHVYERVKPQKGITYFVQGASGQLRAGNLTKTGLTAVGYDQDCSFTAIEISGDDLYFQTISRKGVKVDSGTIRRTVTAQTAPTQ